MSRRILALLAVSAIALAILTGLAVNTDLFRPAEESAAPGGPFQMVDQSGAAVDEDVLKGKWSAVFFGFTHCPDICPTTMFALGQVEPLLGDKAKDFQTVFVSVDPERDTPEQVAAYLSNSSFPKAVIGLTGSAEQVKQIAKAYSAYYQKQGEGEGYQVNHISYTYLMSPRGRFVCVLPYGQTPEQIAAKVTTAMKAGPGAQSC
jgi:protein SCO1/2